MGCGAGPLRGEATISNHRDGSTQAAVWEAFDEWAAATDGGLDPGLSVAHDGPWLVSAKDLSDGILGATSVSGDWIHLDTVRLDEITDSYSQYRDAVKAVALHEIGHAAGIQNHEHGLMRNPVSFANTCVDSAALADMCALVNCGPRSGATCITR